MLENVRNDYWLNLLEPAVLAAHRCYKERIAILWAIGTCCGSEFKKHCSESKARRADGHALQKQAIEITSAQWQRLCSSIWFSAVMLSLHDGLCCIVSYFLFAGPCASWQDFFLSILHFK